MGAHILRGLVACMLVAALVGAGATARIGPTSAAPAAARADASADEVRLVELHDRERTSRGLAALQRDPALDAVAREWSTEMARTGDLRHRPDLATVIERRVTTVWRSWGENIGVGRDVDQLHRALMDSPGHRANILQPDFVRVGVGAHRDGSGDLWVTVDFLEAEPLPDPPADTTGGSRTVPPEGPVPTVPAPTIATPPRSTDDVDVLLVGPEGRVRALGGADHLGDARRERLGEPVVAIDRDPDGRAYRLATAGGDVLVYGPAGHHGDVGGLALAAPVVDLAASASGDGYWLAAADGGVFTHGDARFLGSAGGLPLVAPIVAMAPTPSGRGYWLVAADGGVFTYGDADFHGSAAGRTTAVIADVVARDRGYLLVADDGSIVTLGPDGPGRTRPLAAPGGVSAAS